jgi:hypothetical protein
MRKSDVDSPVNWVDAISHPQIRRQMPSSELPRQCAVPTGAAILFTFILEDQMQQQTAPTQSSNTQTQAAPQYVRFESLCGANDVRALFSDIA